MKPIRTAIFGTGFMGRVHLEAVRRVESVEAIALAGRNAEAARCLGAGFSISAIAIDYRDILRDPAIDAVHICTPNAQHFSMAKDALQAGKHVLCEKPLATSVEEGEELVALAIRQGVCNCVCHNLRYYPMVQQMRRLCEAGDLGEILVVQGTYSQGWLLYYTDWNWRVDAKAGGPSRCLADIGSHWFDMAEHVPTCPIVSTCRRARTARSHLAQALGLFLASLAVGPPLDNEGKKLGLGLTFIFHRALRPAALTRRSNVFVSKSGCISTRRPPDNTTASPQLGSCSAADFLVANSTGTSWPSAETLLLFPLHRLSSDADQACRSSTPTAAKLAPPHTAARKLRHPEDRSSNLSGRTSFSGTCREIPNLFWVRAPFDDPVTAQWGEPEPKAEICRGR